MESSNRFVAMLVGVLASAGVALSAPAGPEAPILGTGQGAPAPVASDGHCASGRYAVTFVAQGESVVVRVRDTAEAWTWESARIDGQAVAHKHGGAACRASVVDMDADQQPEVVVTISDGAPGGVIYVFKRQAGARQFAPIPVEVGRGLAPRDFLVWDMPGSADAPVTLTAFGHIEVQGRLFSLLNQSTGEGLFRWRVSRGMIRHVETVATKPAGQ